MSRRSEQGNVPAFIIIGVLLTAALIGAVIVVRNLQHTGSKIADSSKRSTQNPKDTKDTTPSSSDKSTAANDQALKDALNAQSGSDKSTSSAKNPTNNSTATQSPETSSPTTSSTTTAGSLPKTGPESTFVSVLGATLLVGSGLAYMRSRRLV